MPFVGEKVKEARQQMKPPRSQGTLARDLGKKLTEMARIENPKADERYVSPNTVSEWERGNTEPRGKMFEALVKITGQTHGFFYGEVVSNSLTNKRKAKRSAQ